MKNTIQAALLFLLLLPLACRKNDLSNPTPATPANSKFLQLPPESPSYLQRIAEKIYQQNLSAGFLPQLEQEEGIPVWDKAQSRSLSHNNSPSDTLVLLPLVREGAKQTSGFLVCEVGKEGVNIIELVRNRLYEAYGFDNDVNKVTAHTVALQSLLFDQKIFGDSTFEITDNRLFSSKLSKRTLHTGGSTTITLQQPNTPASARTVMIPKTVCYTVTHKGNKGNLVGTDPGATPDYYYTEEICYTDVIFIPDIPSLPIGGGITPLPGGAPPSLMPGSGGTGSTGTSLNSWFDYCKNGKIKVQMLPGNTFKEVSCGDTLQAWKPKPAFVYTLTDKDRQIIKQVKEEDELADKMLDAPPGCYGTNALGNINRSGTLEHWLIQYDYLATYPNSFREYSIPESSKGGVYRGRADLVNMNTYEMFEIKPSGLKDVGVAEVQHYVDKAKQYCPSSLSGSPKTWTQGVTYKMRTLPYPPDPNKVLQANLAHAGVITYTLVPKNTSPIPIPVAVPQNIRDKIKNLLRELGKDMKDLEEKILVYLHQHPEIVNYIKAAAIGAAITIIVGTIVEDVLTLGAGIADDWASFLLAYKLIRIARLL